VSRSASRQASRQAALQVLYALDLTEKGSPRRGGARREPPGVDAVFAAVAENFDLPAGAREFARELVCGVAERCSELDELIARHARNWRVSRMAAVDRNVLRLAVYELLRGETPVSVVLDQAIELARRFGDEPSPAFVNGVLDAVAQELAGRVGATPAGGGH
jgi:N utilization substance protein B